MRFVTTVAFAVCIGVCGFPTNAVAGWCFPVPFFGAWGAGYAPFYGNCCGGSGCGPMGYAVPCRVGYYGGSVCCSSACNSSCGVGCGADCGAACGTSNGSDKLPDPARDPGFPDGVDDDERSKADPGWDKQDNNSDKTRNRDGSGRNGQEQLRSDEDKPEFLRRGRGNSTPKDAGSLNGLEAEDERSSADDDFGVDGGYGRRSPFEAPAENFNFDSDDAIDIDTRKPKQNEPIYDTESTDEGAESESTENRDDDVFAPPADAETRIRGDLLRGVLSESQARVKHDMSTADLRLTLRIRRARQSPSVLWTGRQSTRQRSLNWIGAPVQDGRMRL
ncbi:MAG: hypothetical protein MK110_08950 [Fuerstiella sp.]|nr:hypothetical protein [Fuerstiella sp.]